ncbi:MAG: hypothetical protein IKN54_03125 [Lachnospiraceae bacterium]|nr:hypothetical protein [Lachnospiraceae bacterium]
MSYLGYRDVDSMIFSVEFMEKLILDYAQKKGYTQIAPALEFAKQKHAGQFRKCKENLAGPYPYVHHPIRVAMHCITLGFDDEDIIVTSLLHDVCEDCGVKFDELPASDTVKKAVSVLTKDEDIHTSDPDYSKYFGKIRQNDIALLVKILDRCSNVTDMAVGFDDARIRKYVAETEELIYPLYEEAYRRFPDKKYALINLEYHTKGIIETIKAV